MDSRYKLNFQVGGTQSTTFHYSSSENLVPHIVGDTNNTSDTDLKHKHTNHTFVFNEEGNVIMDTETIVQIPSPMREGGYHALSENR